MFILGSTSFETPPTLSLQGATPLNVLEGVLVLSAMHGQEICARVTIDIETHHQMV
jgi:hypothetical protein